MAARQAEMVTVWTAEDLTELEESLASGNLAALVVEVPEASAVLTSARELRRLLDQARINGVAVTLATDDPLRRELARIVGAPLTTGAPLAGRASSPDHQTRRIERAILDEDTSIPFRPWQPRVDRDATEIEADDDFTASDPSFRFVVSPPVAPLRAARATAPLPATAVGSQTDSLPVLPPATPAGARSRSLLAVLAALVVAGALVATLALPAATITITPVVAPLSTELTYGVAQPGRTFDITVQPAPIATTVTYSGSVPSTGERFEPDGTAIGSLLLSNASTSGLLVRAGTAFISAAGVTYVTTADVLVPPADPYSSGTFGNASAEVVASLPGPDGNADAETIVGQLASGLFYTNHEPIGGGTVRRIAVVTQADVDGLRAQAQRELDARAATALTTLLQPGQHLLAGTEQRGTPALQIDHQPGEDAETVRVEASLQLTASAYTLDDVHDEARAAVEQRLRGLVGSAAELLPDSIAVTEPEPVAGLDGTAFVVRASARTVARIDPADLDALVADLPGRSEAESLARIQQVAGVADARIALKRDWFTSSLPRLESRIEVEVTGAETVPSQTTPAGP